MSSLIFLLKTTFKNLIKSAFKKPIVLIGYIVLAIFVIGMIVFSFLMPAGLVRKAPPSLFTSIMTLVFMFLYYTTLKLGVDKGSTYFRMADVNLVFTAPVRPNQVLLYGFIKQIAGTIFLLFVAMFQIPNLKNNFELKPYGIGMLMLAVAAYALSYPLISMVIYSWASKVKSRRNIIKRAFDFCALAVAAIFILNLVQTRNLTASLDAIFNHPVARYFPVIGWTGAIASSAVLGFTTEFWVGVSCMILLIIGASVVLYRMNLDFYEDVLEGTEYVEAAVKAKREGNNINFNVKIKEKVNHKLTGTGASAIFSKQLLEMKKTSFFLFLDRTSIVIIISALVFKFMMPEEAGEMNLLLVLAFSVYMLMLFQIQGRLGQEMEKHYIFLIPASSPLKLFYCTLTQHVKNLFDGIVLFTAAGILFKSGIADILACIFAYIAFGAVFVYSDVLSRRLFGWVHSKAMLVIIKFFITLLILVPGIVAAAIAGTVTGSEVLAILAMGGWSLILAITLFLFSSNILNHLETAG